MKISEQEVKRMSQGDPDAFKAIYETCWDTLYYFLRKETGSRYFAECVAQEVFASVWSNRARLTSYALLRDFMAASSRDYALVALKYFASKTFVGAFPDDEAGRRATVVRELVHMLDGEHYKGVFKKILGNLSPSHAIIFHFGLTGSTSEEMSQSMDMPADVVRGYFCEAIVRVKESLKREMTAPAPRLPHDIPQQQPGRSFFG
jgi:DNA-directed RNA polymerase specialized sigma24 family protein